MAGSHHGFLAGRFGARVVLPTVATLEQVDQTGYDDQPETAETNMADQERSHARVLRYIAGGSPKGIAGETLATLEGRHRAPGGNSLRVRVLGANDGLTSNLALVMGVAGAQLKTAAILITGLSGCWRAPSRWRSASGSRSKAPESSISARLGPRRPRFVRCPTRSKKNSLSYTRQRGCPARGPAGRRTPHGR